MPKSVNLENAFANLRRMQIPVSFSKVEEWVIVANIRPVRTAGRLARWLVRILRGKSG